MRKEPLFSVLEKRGINYEHLMDEFTTSEKFITIYISLGGIPVLKQRPFWHLANGVRGS
jgi:hypothetical protein